MRTKMAAMRPDEFDRYVIKHKIIGELGAMELIITEMRDYTEYYHAIGLSGDLASAINGLYSARRSIEEIMQKLAIEREQGNAKD